MSHFQVGQKLYILTMKLELLMKGGNPFSSLTGEDFGVLPLKQGRPITPHLTFLGTRMSSG